jgi:hypothetical protein
MMKSFSCRVVISYVIMVLLFVSLGSCQEELTYGSKVLPYDVDLSRPLSPFCIFPEFAFVDAGILGTFDPGDPVYLNMNPMDCLVSENDVRLSPFGIFPAGSQVTITDPDHGYKLVKFGTRGFPAVELRYFDVDGDEAYSLEDPVYLDFTPGKVNANDLRITSYKNYAAGSRVRDSDLDSDKPTLIFTGTLSFFNANGNINARGYGLYDGGDVIYADTQLPLSAVTVNDVRMSEGPIYLALAMQGPG